MLHIYLYIRLILKWLNMSELVSHYAPFNYILFVQVDLHNWINDDLICMFLNRDLRRDINRDYVVFQTPSEHEMEMGIKSKEARKYIFNCLDDMMQVEEDFSR